MVETLGARKRPEKPVGRGTQLGGRRDDRVRSADVPAARTCRRRFADLTLVGVPTERPRRFCI